MSRPAVALLPASAVSLDALREAFNAFFADYLIPLVPLDDAGWCAFLQRQGADLASSLVAVREDEVVAFALRTPRTQRRARVAVMGARPEVRRTGLGARLLDALIGAARTRQETFVDLEVFTSNENAARLYRARGFVAVCELAGFRAAPDAGRATDEAVDEVARGTAATWLDALDRDEPRLLPWQTGGDALRAVPGEVTAWRIGAAQLVFRAESSARVVVVSLWDRDAAQANAARLLGVLRARFPHEVLHAPQLQRADAAAQAFTEAGWERLPLSQQLMRLELQS